MMKSIGAKNQAGRPLEIQMECVTMPYHVDRYYIHSQLVTQGIY